MVERIPLYALIPARLDAMADQVKARLCEDEQVGGMKLAWDFIASELGNALKSVLDGDLLEILAEAWAKAAPLAELADPAKHPPGERSLVELGGHDVNREFRPVVAITIGSCPCVELNFTFTLAAHVGGVRLSIVDRHIVGGDLGEVWASAQLSCEGTPLHAPAESQKLVLPAEFRFDPPGIALPRLEQDRARSG